MQVKGAMVVSGAPKDERKRLIGPMQWSRPAAATQGGDGYIVTIVYLLHPSVALL